MAPSITLRIGENIYFFTNYPPKLEAPYMDSIYWFPDSGFRKLLPRVVATNMEAGSVVMVYLQAHRIGKPGAHFDILKMFPWHFP
jgi:hypothetical protein